MGRHKGSKDLRPRTVTRFKTGLYIKAPSGLRLRDRTVQRLTAKMREQMPWLTNSDLPAMRGFAELEYLCAAAFSELKRKGITNEKGDPRRLLGDYRLLRQTQLAYERELGMTPASRATLAGSPHEDDLAALLARSAIHSDGETVEPEQPARESD